MNVQAKSKQKLLTEISILKQKIAQLEKSKSERKQVDNRLRESEKRLSKAQEIAHLGSWELDLSTNSLIWSDEIFRIFGLQPQEFDATYAAFLDTIHPDDRAEVDVAYSSSLREGRDIYEIEHRIIRKNTGEIRYVHEKCEHVRDTFGRIVRSIGMVHDITEQKLAEKVLRENDERLRLKLTNVLSPDYRVEEEELRNIIDSDVIQSLMDDFYKLTQIGIAIIDLGGNILVATGWQDICTRFHRVHPETSAKCIESDLVLSQGVPPGEIKGYKCENNLWDFVTPIFIGEKHMGNLYLGQFFFEDEAPDYDLFDQQADRYGFDKVEYRAALDRVPRWNRERVNIVLTFYRKMADMISRLSFGNLKLAIELSKRKQTEATLNSSLSLLNAAMESTADGILIVDRNGQIVQYNQIFADLWQVPRELLGIYVDDNPVLNHVVQQMAQPEAFLEKVLDLYAHPEASSFDTLNLADGRAFERYSQPQRIGSEIVGRVWSFRDVTERKRAEKALKEAQKGLEKKVQERTTELKKINRLLTLEIEERKNTEAELDNSYQQLRVFNQRWVEIEELERKRLSAELHDEIGQYLTALGINLSIVKMNLPPGADTLLHDRIDESFNLLKRTTAQIKGVMSNLRPTVLDEYGLVPALQWYTEENAKRTGIEIFFTADELPYRPATEIEIALFRIAQEAINNAIKHARANRINMTLNYSENILFLVIVDDGAGFETQAVQDRDDPGWGLMIMRERCLGIRGLFRVESIPGEGTRISAEVPL